MPKPPIISSKVQEQIYRDLMRGGMRRFGDAVEVFADFILTDLPAKKRKSPEELTLDYHLGEEAAEHRRRLAAAAIENIPRTRRIFPAPQIAGPVFRDSEFEPEDTPIWQLWKELLARACDRDRVREAHPAYPEIIRQLSADEALMLRELHRTVPASDYKKQNAWRGHPGAVAHAVQNRLRAADLALSFAENTWRYVDNLKRLGLIGEHDLFALNAETPGEMYVLINKELVPALTITGHAFMDAVTPSMVSEPT